MIGCLCVYRYAYMYVECGLPSACMVSTLTYSQKIMLAGSYLTMRCATKRRSLPGARMSPLLMVLSVPGF